MRDGDKESVGGEEKVGGVGNRNRNKNKNKDKIRLHTKIYGSIPTAFSLRLNRG